VPAISPDEAAVVQRIFREYAAGTSPRKIASDLNADGIPSPRGRGPGSGSGHWKQNTINGNRERGTGILNNEIYIGRRIWNRLQYSKHPDTNKRVSRLNPQENWIVSEDPGLRIIDDALWGAVKAQQDSLARRRRPRTSSDRNGLSASQGLRRRKFLLSGLLQCRQCGGNLTVAGSGKTRRYYCANAKEKGPTVCTGMKGLKEADAAKPLLDVLKTGLMEDEAYAEFSRRFTAHLRDQSKDSAELLRLHDRKVRELEKTHGNLMNAVESGKFSDAVIDRLNAVDAELKALKARRAELEPSSIDLPPDLPVLYRAYVADLVETLSGEEVAGRASDELHELIETVIVDWDAEIGAHRLELRGNLVRMLNATKPAGEAGFAGLESSLKLVAGVRFEPMTLRL